ncbi:HEAT repeat domain-containing protein [Streptomyces sp. NPDC001795]|uniref:HEAT repeat domain-containing protein n=1 Tax=Streptomyces sp. NPDC001795 TaxID=3154525 RepID=UPI0033324330
MRHLGHPDTRVRREVPYLLAGDGRPATLQAQDALLTLTRAPDSEVRATACNTLGSPRDLTTAVRRALITASQDSHHDVRAAAAAALAGSGDRTAAAGDALPALTGDDDITVRLEAAYGLARRDRTRTQEALERVGPLGPDIDTRHDHRVSVLSSWEWRTARRADGGTGPG